MACAACAKSSTLGFGLRKACQTCKGYKNVILDQSTHVSLRFGGSEIFAGRTISSSQARLPACAACATCASRVCSVCNVCKGEIFVCKKKFWIQKNFRYNYSGSYRCGLWVHFSRSETQPIAQCRCSRPHGFRLFRTV